VQKFLPLDPTQFDPSVNKVGFLTPRDGSRDLSRPARAFLDRTIRSSEDVRGLEGRKVPLRWTLLAVALFCSAFWALVAWLVLAL
jgi:hypothetical protein